MDILTDASLKSWIIENLQASSNGHVIKSRILELLKKDFQNLKTPSMQKIGKILKECFPEAETKRINGAQSFSHVQWLRSSNFDLGTMLSLLHSRVPVLKRCPKGARIPLCKLLKKYIDEVYEHNNPEVWSNLLLLPYNVLRVPSKSESGNNLTSFVKNQISKNPTSEDIEILFNTIEKKVFKSSSVESKIESKLSIGDISGAVRLLNSTDSIAENNNQTLEFLRSKHPNPSVSTSLIKNPSSIDNVLIEDNEEVTKLINSFPNGSAGGLDSLRPQILKDITCKFTGVAGQDLIESIKNLLNLILSGKTCEFIRPLLFEASLLALRKKDGGIRPIAIGCTWRRLASKYFARKIPNEVLPSLLPFQMGVGVKNGAELICHASRLYFNSPHKKDQVLVTLDFKNAFNEISRNAILKIINEEFPQYSQYINHSYEHPSDLYYFKEVIQSSSGIQQGDPLGPVLFCLGINNIVHQLKSSFNVWYLDDGIICGTLEEVMSDLELIISKGQDIGLTLNPTKCEMKIFNEDPFYANQIQSILPGVKEIDEANFFTLGCGMTHESIIECLEVKTKALVDTGDRLKKLSTHSAIFLLQKCVSMPKLTYFLRCSPSWRCEEALLKYDLTLKSLMEDILNIKLDSESWIQSSLPVSQGGLGISHSLDSSLPMFLASKNSCSDKLEQLVPDIVDVDYNEGLRIWEDKFNLPITPAIQKSWTHELNTTKLNSLKSNAKDNITQARLHAYTQPHTGDWLNAIPSSTIGTHLENTVFSVCCALRLGANICEEHVCSCGSKVSKNGIHGLSCKFSKGRRPRHDEMNDLIFRSLRSANVPCIREPNGCSTKDGSRPDGLTLVPWKKGMPMIWDYTCTDTFAPSYVEHSALKPGYAVKNAEENKIKKYSDLKAYHFIPFASETSGIIGQDGNRFIKQIGDRLQIISGEEMASTYLFQRISLIIQKGNAISILGTLPDGRKLEEILFI